MSEALKILQEFRENKRYSYMYDRIDTAIDGVLAKQEQENLTPREGLAEYKKGYAKAELDLKLEPLSDDVICDGLPHSKVHDYEIRTFIKGVKFAEKMHGIGVDDE